MFKHWFEIFLNPYFNEVDQCRGLSYNHELKVRSEIKVMIKVRNFRTFQTNLHS